MKQYNLTNCEGKAEQSKVLKERIGELIPLFETCSVKVSFTDCPVEDRKRFYRSNCILPISVGLGLKIHEGDKFLGTLKLINSAFNSFTILLDDSIQRYTMRILDHSPEKEIHDKAVKEGDLWLQRNRYIIKLATIPYKIMRWNDWLNHREYQKQREKIEELYQKDQAYRSCLEETIEDFLVRFKKNLEEEDVYRFDYNYAYESCLLYLKEECSVMCLWAEAQYDFEVYSTGRNKAMAATYDRMIKPYFPERLKSVSLHFRKYSASFLNQKFENFYKNQLDNLCYTN